MRTSSNIYNSTDHTPKLVKYSSKPSSPSTFKAFYTVKSHLSNISFFQEKCLH